MADQSYTREELEKFGDALPEKGLFCKKCQTFIPQFAELSETDEYRIKHLAGSQTVLAIKELMHFTGCSVTFAEIWVEHEGKPEPLYDYPCPFCGELLRTSEAKQCRFCKRDWHDENELKWLK
jgi:hypothetical protein